MKIVTCNSNNALAESIATKLKKPLCKSSIKRFADMEIFVEIFALGAANGKFNLDNKS